MPRTKKYLIDNRTGFDLICGDFCYFTNAMNVRDLRKVDLKISPNETVPPGTHFTRLGGTKTSAGYTTIDMIAPSALIYEGMIEDLHGLLAVFRQTAGDATMRVCWWYFLDDQPYMIFCTRFNSARVVELTNCEYELSDG